MRFRFRWKSINRVKIGRFCKTDLRGLQAARGISHALRAASLFQPSYHKILRLLMSQNTKTNTKPNMYTYYVQTHKKNARRKQYGIQKKKQTKT